MARPCKMRAWLTHATVRALLRYGCGDPRYGTAFHDQGAFGLPHPIHLSHAKPRYKEHHPCWPVREDAYAGHQHHEQTIADLEERLKRVESELQAATEQRVVVDIARLSREYDNVHAALERAWDAWKQ